MGLKIFRKKANDGMPMGTGQAESGEAMVFLDKICQVTRNPLKQRSIPQPKRIRSRKECGSFN